MHSKIPVYATIGIRSPVVHRHGGRGVITHLYANGTEVAVRFGDDRLATRVLIRDLTPMPAKMPPERSGEVVR